MVTPLSRDASSKDKPADAIAVARDPLVALGNRARVEADVVNAPGVERSWAALDAMYLVALREQHFGELGAIPTRDTGNLRGFIRHCLEPAAPGGALTLASDAHRRQRVASERGTHSRRSSLIEVFARVCASTRLTITAQYSEYLPSAEGRLPGTTTAPAGTRP